MRLVLERPHEKYGSAIFVKQSLDVLSAALTCENDVEDLAIELQSCTVSSVYKPPSNPFSFQDPTKKKKNRLRENKKYLYIFFFTKFYIICLYNIYSGDILNCKGSFFSSRSDTYLLISFRYVSQYLSRSLMNVWSMLQSLMKFQYYS